MKILDIHTHNLSPNPEAIIDISDAVREGRHPFTAPGGSHNLRTHPDDISKLPAGLRPTFSDGDKIPAGFRPGLRSGLRLSVGVHPWWLTEELPAATLEAIERAAEDPRVVLIGEAGIDTLKGGPLFRQMLLFKKMVELSERLEKPLLIHDVKAHEIIIGIWKEMRPRQQWIIHGFRSKQTVADMFLRIGAMLSFGESFNPMVVHNIPYDRILAETDCSPLSIEEIIHSLSDARGTDLTHIIAENSSRLLKGKICVPSAFGK